MFSFGSNNSNTQANTTTTGIKFGGSTTATTSTPTTGLFGSTSKQSSGFTFGTTATSAPATNTFGTTTTSVSSTNLFGATASSAPTTSLFGATASSAPSTNLFGATTSSTSTGGLFGAKTSAPSMSSFGSTVTTTPQTANKTTSGFAFGTSKPQTTGMFGSTATTTAAGATATQPINLQTLAPDTHYSALPDNMKLELDNLDKMIQDQIHIFESISQSTIPNAIQKVNEDTQELSQKLTSLTNILERDNYLINDLKKKVAGELRNAELATRFIDRLNNQNQTKDIYSFHDGISEYFENLCTGFEEKMQIYRQSIDEIEQQLLSMSQNTQHNPQELVEILRNQHESIMYLSSKVASLNDDIDKRRQEYQSFRSKYSNDVPSGNIKNKTVNEKLSLSTIASSLKPSASLNASSMQPAAASTTNKFGGFGTTGTSGFGSTSTAFGSATGTTAFGSTNTTTAFGANKTGFGTTGTTTTGFGTTSTGFGNTNTTTAFGANKTGFGTTGTTTTGFGTTSTGFGNTNTTTAFGANKTGFGTTGTTTTGFGTTSTGFGSTSTSLFNSNAPKQGLFK
ncbi:hypothetical protein BCR36DRAFT_413643 [Piromyces finnis]|uniref:Nucleoporin NSP1-like C-terminal domain-containing protein n=1 Tax=Piromyces finnis TaxID=1754191 RepID=A0A1Y1V615_9FUNG|nr:hypothetical protein BCR36DRAFT_413643 [Piromyces finnis]|eukprot:ORX47293.1 hypothetical protein BCR36DRAFT_413643 [Piromyces finnis]